MGNRCQQTGKRPAQLFSLDFVFTDPTPLNCWAVVTCRNDYPFSCGRTFRLVSSWMLSQAVFAKTLLVCDSPCTHTHFSPEEMPGNGIAWLRRLEGEKKEKGFFLVFLLHTLLWVKVPEMADLCPLAPVAIRLIHHSASTGGPCLLDSGHSTSSLCPCRPTAGGGSLQGLTVGSPHLSLPPFQLSIHLCSSFPVLTPPF